MWSELTAKVAAKLATSSFAPGSWLEATIFEEVSDFVFVFVFFAAKVSTQFALISLRCTLLNYSLNYLHRSSGLSTRRLQRLLGAAWGPAGAA